jgi:trehalose synthase
VARVVEDLPPRLPLREYEAVAHLAPAVERLRDASSEPVRRLRDRTIWMVSSTETGGGVAEMLPTMIVLLRELGLDVRWIVLESDDPKFFSFTKSLHNLIHGMGTPDVLDDSGRDLYERVALANAEGIRGMIRDGDILVVHDPQPLPLAGLLGGGARFHAVWRCHIGLDEKNPATEAAWGFLEKYADAYKMGVFSAPEYAPDAFEGKGTVLYPAIDPLSPKNEDLSLRRTVSILANSALLSHSSPVLTPVYRQVAMRLQVHGEFGPANMSEDIGLLSRPVITQVSRWDRLKGWGPLLEAFRCLKERARRAVAVNSAFQVRRLELVRLVLAGPDPDSVADDPEGREVLASLCQQYLDLPPHIQRDVALIALPMQDLEQNAHMVNALQRASTLVVQNSLREGFGLTVAEAMWKGVPVLSNRKACGPRQQVRDRVDGRLIEDPENPAELCEALDETLGAWEDRKVWGRNAKRRVHSEFLVFSQLQNWLHLLGDLVDPN